MAQQQGNLAQYFFDNNATFRRDYPPQEIQRWCDFFKRNGWDKQSSLKIIQSYHLRHLDLQEGTKCVIMDEIKKFRDNNYTYPPLSPPLSSSSSIDMDKIRPSVDKLMVPTPGRDDDQVCC